MLAYNILRGFEVDAQLDMITSGVDFPVPDVLLLSEVDRGCQRTEFRNIAREYAERLGYYYVYATEFVELPGDRGRHGAVRPAALRAWQCHRVALPARERAADPARREPELVHAAGCARPR